MRFIGCLILFVIFSSLFISGCDHPIGGERDSHGCLGPAGYSWDKDANACIREWELDETQKQASKIAVNHVGYEKGIAILDVLVARCPGCFTVTLENGNKRIKVIIVEYKVTDVNELDDVEHNVKLNN